MPGIDPFSAINSQIRNAVGNFFRANPGVKDAAAPLLNIPGMRDSFSPAPAQAPVAISGPLNNGVNFEAQVRGSQPKPIDRELGKISQAVYANPPARAGNWRPMAPNELPPELRNKIPGKNGLVAAVYTDGTRHVLAFRGRDNLQSPDAVAVGAQFVGLPSDHYTQAAELGRAFDHAYGNNGVVTGHSLGGGLAATAARAAGDKPAVTFAAQASPETAPGQIRTYNLAADPLLAFQRLTGRKSAGHEFILGPPGLDPNMHNMDQILRFLPV